MIKLGEPSIRLSPTDWFINHHVSDNAVFYFKGSWTSPFETELTSEQAFNLVDGQTVTVPTMYQKSGSFDYLKSSGFQALRLPWWRWTDGHGTFFADPEYQLEWISKPAQSGQLVELAGAFWRPRHSDDVFRSFTMEYEKSLNQVLAELGMGIAFEPRKSRFFGAGGTWRLMISISAMSNIKPLLRSTKPVPKPPPWPRSKWARPACLPTTLSSISTGPFSMPLKIAKQVRSSLWERFSTSIK